MKKKKSKKRSCQAGGTANRTYKSTIFIMIFEDKRNLLELYNAVSGKHYTDPKLLRINTLENAIYMSMKNDVSFVIDARLSLYEHQSTYSPNLPLRFLMYISAEYSVMTRDANLYGSKLVRIPPPQFIIFYNGEGAQPERRTLRLSDMYAVREKEISLELNAVMLNINGGYNQKLKETCKTLKDYAEYTDRVRRYAKETELDDAVERAITECIREGILKEFLEQNRAEVKYMSIFEYDQEKHMRQEREEAWESGRIAGEKKLLYTQIQKKQAKGNTIKEIAAALETEEAIILRAVEEMRQGNEEHQERE